MRDTFQFEHEVFGNEGREDLSPHHTPASPVMGGSPSEDWTNSCKIEATLWHVIVEIDTLAKQLEKEFKFWREDAAEDIRLAANKLERIAKSFEERPL